RDGRPPGSSRWRLARARRRRWSQGHGRPASATCTASVTWRVWSAWWSGKGAGDEPGTPRPGRGAPAGVLGRGRRGGIPDGHRVWHLLRSGRRAGGTAAVRHEGALEAAGLGGPVLLAGARAGGPRPYARQRPRRRGG